MASLPPDPPGSLTFEGISAVIGDLCRRGRFFVRSDLPLAWWTPAGEEISWEIYRGRLLDPAHTRQTRRLIAWSIYQNEGASAHASEPLLSVKLDTQAGEIHVVRAILSHVWEGFDAGDNIIQSRETTKWVRELVGTICLHSCAAQDLRAELRELLRAAVEGTSRLPLTSVEAPLPAFSLGQLAYLPAASQNAASGAPRTNWQELLEIPCFPLEVLLRTLSPEQAGVAAKKISTGVITPSHFRQVFLQASLSPYTEFVDTTLAFVKALVGVGRLSVADEVDLWGWLLCQLGRHLTAYDLITFHHRGANYPDALVLDAALKRYAQLIETQPELFREDVQAHRLRRRALRQGCLLRRYYEGHPVPDAPTSPGENTRVLPSPYVRVPEDQLLNILRRRKRLYAGEALPALLGHKARALLRESILDLADPREWRELGTAVFIDRPLGWGKAVGEPDRTPLLAHEGYSPSIARRRFQELERLAGELVLEAVGWDSLRTNENLKVRGLPAAQLAEPDRPVVALADARRVADDFVVCRTLRQGLAQVFKALDFTPLKAEMPFLEPAERLLLVRLPGTEKETVLALFDSNSQKRLELATDLSEGFVTRRGTEMPAAGLHALRSWNEAGEMAVRNIRIKRS